jgi:catechol 2,3-dioxygenase-like lactoylglutathione lyase family enzyme
MNQLQIPVCRIRHLCLRVRDVQRSLAFYCDVLGFQETHENGCQKPSHACVLHDPDGGGRLELVLTQGLPPGEYLVGLDHLAFEAPSVAGVNEAYRRATQASIRATEPRLQNGWWKSFLFDPDGYKLEVGAPADEALPPDA